MRTNRVIWVSILFWILIFVEVSVLMALFGLDNNSNIYSLTSIIQKIIHFILLIPITYLACKIYYQKKDNLNGYVFGLLMILIGNILDILITIPLFVKSFSFYNIWLFIGLIEVAVLSGIFGKKMKK